MRKSIVVGALLVSGIFAAGYAVGQVGGVTGSAAAGAVTTTTTTLNGIAPDAGRPDGPGHDTPHADGTVTAINGDTLTIAAGNDPAGTNEYTGVTTVVLTSNTQYDPGHDSATTATKSSIKVGSYIIVDGTVSADGKTITATHVGINAGGPVPGR